MNNSDFDNIFLDEDLYKKILEFFPYIKKDPCEIKKAFLNIYRAESIYIGNRLAFYRKEKGYSQVKISSYLNVRQATCSEWEHGKSLPSLKRLIEICSIYNISFKDLLPSRFSNVTDLSNKILIELDKDDFLFFFESIVQFQLYLLSLYNNENNKMSSYSEKINKLEYIKETLWKQYSSQTGYLKISELKEHSKDSTPSKILYKIMFPNK